MFNALRKPAAGLFCPSLDTSRRRLLFASPPRRKPNTVRPFASVRRPEAGRRGAEPEVKPRPSAAPAVRLPRTGANPGTRAGKTRSGRTAGSESAGACGGLARRVRPLPAELAVRFRGRAAPGPARRGRAVWRGLARSWELSADRRPRLWAAGRQCAGQPAAGGHGGGSEGAGGDAALAGGAARQYPGPRGHVSRCPLVDSRGEETSYS